MNLQNDKVWSVPREKLTVPRYQNMSAVMVWAAISRKGSLPLVFIDRGVKMLNTTKRRLCSGFYFRRPKNYMETRIIASSKTGRHHTNIVRRWCEYNLTDFIPKDEWPPSSPDLNPLFLYLRLHAGTTEKLLICHFARIQESYPTDLGQYTGTCRTCRVRCF
jgi:hypothetical protein